MAATTSTPGRDFAGVSAAASRRPARTAAICCATTTLPHEERRTGTDPTRDLAMVSAARLRVRPWASAAERGRPRSIAARTAGSSEGGGLPASRLPAARRHLLRRLRENVGKLGAVVLIVRADEIAEVAFEKYEGNDVLERLRLRIGLQRFLANQRLHPTDRRVVITLVLPLRSPGAGSGLLTSRALPLRAWLYPSNVIGYSARGIFQRCRCWHRAASLSGSMRTAPHSRDGSASRRQISTPCSPTSPSSPPAISASWVDDTLALRERGRDQQFEWRHGQPAPRRPNGVALTVQAIECGAPDRSRTCDLWLRKPTLYPTELRARGPAFYRAPRTSVQPRYNVALFPSGR